MLATEGTPRAFAERVMALLERVEYRRVGPGAELDVILRLRYDAFFREGTIAYNRSERLPDDFDAADHVYNFGIFIDGELASALRIHRLLPFAMEQKSPALKTFEDILVPQIKAGRSILDPNRFVANYELARKYPELPFITLRPVYMAAELFGADLITMTVRTEHQAFYRRSMYAYPVTPPRAYPMLKKPISLLLINFNRDAARIIQRHPYARSRDGERRALFGDPVPYLAIRSDDFTPKQAAAAGIAGFAARRV